MSYTFSRRDFMKYTALTLFAIAEVLEVPAYRFLIFEE